SRARQLIRVIRGVDQLTPSLTKLFPELEERLGSGTDQDWTVAFLAALNVGLKKEDLEPLAARAVRGAATRPVRAAVLDAVQRWELRQAIPEIANLLKDPDDQVRIAASTMLRELKAREAIPRIIQL